MFDNINLTYFFLLFLQRLFGFDQLMCLTILLLFEYVYFFSLSSCMDLLFDLFPNLFFLKMNESTSILSKRLDLFPVKLLKNIIVIIRFQCLKEEFCI